MQYIITDKEDEEEKNLMMVMMTRMVRKSLNRDRKKDLYLNCQRMIFIASVIHSFLCIDTIFVLRNKSMYSVDVYFHLFLSIIYNTL